MTRPLTRRGVTPLEKILHPLEKCAGHILKLLDIVKKICLPFRKLFAPLPWCPKLVMGLHMTKAINGKQHDYEDVSVCQNDL